MSPWLVPLSPSSGVPNPARAKGHESGVQGSHRAQSCSAPRPARVRPSHGESLASWAGRGQRREGEVARELRQLNAVSLSSGHSLEWGEKGESGERSHGYDNAVFRELAPSQRASWCEMSCFGPLQEKVQGTSLD